MANPATKNNLESSHFLSFSAAVQTRLLSCLRSDGGNIRPFSAPSEAIEAIKQGLNRVQPKNPGMKQITDTQNAFGQSTVDAVLAYKSINGIIRTGQKLDNIVGRGTLARLDTEQKMLDQHRASNRFFRKTARQNGASISSVTKGFLAKAYFSSVSQARSCKTLATSTCEQFSPTVAWRRASGEPAWVRSRRRKKSLPSSSTTACATSPSRAAHRLLFKARCCSKLSRWTRQVDWTSRSRCHDFATRRSV